jgi:hypothetical protein
MSADTAEGDPRSEHTESQPDQDDTTALRELKVQVEKQQDSIKQLEQLLTSQRMVQDGGITDSRDQELCPGVCPELWFYARWRDVCSPRTESAVALALAPPPNPPSLRAAGVHDNGTIVQTWPPFQPRAAGFSLGCSTGAASVASYKFASCKLRLKNFRTNMETCLILSVNGMNGKRDTKDFYLLWKLRQRALKVNKYWKQRSIRRIRWSSGHTFWQVTVAWKLSSKNFALMIQTYTSLLRWQKQ